MNKRGSHTNSTGNGKGSQEESSERRHCVLLRIYCDGYCKKSSENLKQTLLCCSIQRTENMMVNESEFERLFKERLVKEEAW